MDGLPTAFNRPKPSATASKTPTEPINGCIAVALVPVVASAALMEMCEYIKLDLVNRTLHPFIDGAIAVIVKTITHL